MTFYSGWVWFRCLMCGRAFRVWHEGAGWAKCSYCKSRQVHDWETFLDIVRYRHPEYPTTPILGKLYRMR